eukprot:TRINITY_DN9300_c0_g1_i1.p1 TRINITY_DN9300_c0_g1~~TRINITY_DN9300_c0_g1_i1.p1  ORF type:complete len:225 (-),score=46.56 TRINITY_DN9300_c0_g1_i1:297-971(-)
MANNASMPSFTHSVGVDLATLTPPELFGIVESGLYRSNTPFHAHFSYLRSLRVKTLIRLSAEIPTKAFLSFVEDCGIHVINLGQIADSGFESWKPLREELVKECLEILLDKKYYPILVTCSSGIHLTGSVIGCLRRLQGWSLNSILDEYRRYAGNKSRTSNELFIELFDTDLVTFPSEIVGWFIRQQEMMVEEEESGYVDPNHGPLVSSKTMYTSRSIVEDEED